MSTQVSVKHSDTYKQVYVDEIFGGHSFNDFRVHLMSTDTDPTANINVIPTRNGASPIIKTIEVELVMTPFRAKTMLGWLANHVKLYEQMFGKIPSPKEVLEMTKAPPDGEPPAHMQ